MRLVRKLLRTVAVLAAAAAALGGAAALGSTLFEKPPRDAAAFAARAQAASERAAEAGMTRAEIRYLRALEASCREQVRTFGALGRPSTLRELATYLERALALARRYQREDLRVETPRRFRDEERRYRALGDEGVELLEAMLAAARRGDPETVALLGAALVELAEDQNAVAQRLGAGDCVVEPPVESADAV